MREKIISIIIIIGLAGLAGVYFSGGEGGTPRENMRIENILKDHSAGGKLNIYHWWTAGGEKEAIEAALKAFENEYPNVNAVSNPIPGGAGGAMVMKIKIKVAAGDAPETFQAHPGYEIRPYYDIGALRKVNDIWVYAGLENRVREGVADLCRVENDYYLVPIGIHKTNTVWYNKHMFNKYGVELPKKPLTWSEFWALCDELKRKLPSGKYPLALGDRMGYMASFTFEQIMAGTDMGLYESFINGNIEPSQLEPVLERYKKFLSYVPPDHTARLWYQAAGKVYSGKCAMYVQLGAIKGIFTSLGWEYGVDYGSFSVPGTSDWFGVCTDAFTVPKGSDYPANSFRWAYMCSTPEVQEVFCPAKEAISPYKDTPLSIYHEGTRRLAEDLRDPEIRTFPSFTHGTAIPWSALMDLGSRCSGFTTSSDPDVSRHARLIAQALSAANVHGTWDIV